MTLTSLLSSLLNAPVKALDDDELLDAADGLDGALEEALGLKALLETPPPMLLTLAAVEECIGRPSLS